MKRYAQDKQKTERRWKEHRNFHVRQQLDSMGQEPPFNPFEVACPCDNQSGRFHKRKPLDCGKPRCFTCHGPKLAEGNGGPTFKRRLAERDYHEQLAEVDLT